jgi:IS5 family transposase
MIGKTNDQGSLVQLVSLEELVPPEHFLRKLDRVLDLSFMAGLMATAYHPTHGREGIPPKLAMRMILLGYLFDLSEVRLCEEVGMHAGYRWFCRLDFHDSVPDRTTLVKFRARCREHGLWEELFHRIVAQCGDVGLLSGCHLMADSTQVQANASIKSLREIESDLVKTADRLCTEEEQPPKPDKDDDHHHTDFHGKRFSNGTHRSASDPDARFYRKGRGKEAKLSYKVHNLADTKSRVIVATSATRVSGDDASDGAQALALLEQASEVHGIKPNSVCGDTMYGNAKTITALYHTGITPHIPLLCKTPPEIPSWKRRTFNIDHLRKRKEKLAQAVALNRAAELPDSKGYKISRKLRHRIEHLFGEAKQSHGLARARFRGLGKMNEQATLTATAQNLKRLVKFLDKPGRVLSSKKVSHPKHLWVCFYSPFLNCISRAIDLLGHFAIYQGCRINQPALENG